MNATPPLNQILYGPPGTGKTYHTINEALAIIEQKTLENLEKEVRDELKKRFDSYVQKGQILFCTFHQSMSYEDFVEGIKPITRDEQVIYEVQDGIFKLICERAGRKKEILNFEEVYEQFTQDTLDKPIEIKTPIRKSPFDVQVSKNGECWVLTRGEKETKFPYFKDTIKVFLTEKNAHSDSTYLPAICEYLQTHYGLKVVSATQLPYILIIDEINRGNVSQIFGELITLIEESKRSGETESLEITLPYSKKAFSVPNNLYLIGTMNTADRSVEALDTALRRRFVFKEMLPNASLLKPCEGIDLQLLLTKINERLAALLSKEHCIGHAYFINCQCIADVENAFYQKILPLLQEYFYGDLGKIQLVIGEDFVQIDNVPQAIFMKSRNNVGSLPEKVTFLKPQDFVASIQKIYL